MGKKKISFENTEIAFQHYSKNALKRAFSVYQLLGNSVFNKVGATIAKIAIAVHFPIKPFVKPLIFKQFCGGESLSESLSTIHLLQQRGVSSNLHYGVETKKTEKEFNKTLDKNLGAIEFAGRNTSAKVVSCKITGMGSISLLQKIQEKEVLSNNEKEAFDRLKERIDQLCELAASNGTKVYWDAEETWVQDVIDELVDHLMATYNKEEAIVYNTFQMYRTDRLKFLASSKAKAEEGKYILGAKLVRGAYMEKEREWAEEHELPSPIYPTKEATDEAFDEAVKYCLDNVDIISVCVASHNEESNAKAAQLMEELSIPNNHKHLWFSQLYGMGEHLSFNLAHHGYNATKYIPYGPVKDVIPYLIRRAEENTSVDGQLSREMTIIKKEMKRRGL